MTVMRLSELTWNEVAAAAPDALLLLPIGSQEQHAGHLPMGTDTLLVEAALEEALASFGGSDLVLVRAPTLPYGHSPHHLFRAAASITASTLLQVLGDLLDSLHASGFRRFMIINGHGGNTEVIGLAVKQFALRAPVAAAACSYWQTEPISAADAASAADASTDADVEDPARTPGHAGWFETSLMLAAHPDLVRPPTWSGGPDPAPLFDRSPHPGLLVERHGEWSRVGGITDDPTRADTSTGQALLGRRGRGLAEAITSFDAATRDRDQATKAVLDHPTTEDGQP